MPTFTAKFIRTSWVPIALLYLLLGAFLVNIQWDYDLRNRFLPDDPAVKARESERARFGAGEKLYLFIEGAELPDYQDLLEIPLISNVASLKKDGRGTILILDLDESVLAQQANRQRVVDQVNEWMLQQQNSTRMTLGGAIALQMRVAEAANHDTFRIGAVLTLVLCGILYVFFRSVLAVISIVLLGGINVAATFGLIGLSAYPISHFSLFVIPVIMAISLLDNIHLTYTYCQFRQEGKSSDSAVRHALTDLFAPCSGTTLTTIAGFCVLGLSSMSQVRHFGLVAAIGTGFAWLTSFTLLPVLLSRLDPKMSERFSSWVTRGVLKLPLRPIVVGAGLLCIAALPGLFQLQLNPDFPKLFAADHPITQDWQRIDDDWGGLASISYLLTLKPEYEWKDPQVESRLQDLTVLLQQRPLVTSVMPSEFDSDSNTLRLVAQVRMMLPEKFPQLARDLYGFQDNLADLFDVQLTGWPLIFKNMETELLRELFILFAMAFTVVALLLLILFRSWRWWLVSLAPNLLPLIVVLGFLGYVGEGLSTGLLMVPGMALGLVVDDTIHYVTRLRRETGSEGRRDGGVIERTFEKTGVPIFMTSVVLSAGFATLFLSQFRGNLWLAGTMIAMILLAFVADVILLPALSPMARKP